MSAFGTLAALIERGKTGRGQKVEGALLRTAIAFANATLIEQALTGVDRVATVNRGFNCGPGRYLPLHGRLDRRDRDRPADVPALGRMIGEEHWLADPRFADDQSRADHGEIISARMSEWCAERSCAEALAALEEASIVAGQVYSPQQALDDPHIRAAHLLEERELTRPRPAPFRWRRPRSSCRKPPAPTAARRRCSASTPTRSSRASATPPPR